jgi:hypothetical protein
MKVPLNAIMEKAQRYWSDEHVNTHLRMGQFLMNELAPKERNPDIFYNRNNDNALGEFIETYGETQC